MLQKLSMNITLTLLKKKESFKHDAQGFKHKAQSPSWRVKLKNKDQKLKALAQGS